MKYLRIALIALIIYIALVISACVAIEQAVGFPHVRTESAQNGAGNSQERPQSVRTSGYTTSDISQARTFRDIRTTWYSYGPGAIGACGKALVGNYAAVPQDWHKAFPCGSHARVCYHSRCVGVWIADTEGGTGHRIDIAPGAFRKLAPLSQGVFFGRVEKR